jgi:hypothetical protein
MWTKRDCFVLMDCDSKEYWNSPQVQAGINIWKNTPRVRSFLEEWLEYCKDPRIITDQPNTCGEDNLTEYQDHRHDQSILTNLLIKKGIRAFGNPQRRNFKHRDVGFISAHVAVEKLTKNNQLNLDTFAERHKSYRLDRGYIPFYQLLMEEKRNQRLSILELQNNQDESSTLWSEYLPKAKIFKIGINKPSDHADHDSNRINFRKIDLGHRPTMETLRLQMKNQNMTFDYIIDAGSGLMHDQQLAIGTLFDLLKPEGIFIIEAMEKSQMPGTGDVRPDRSNTTLQLIRRINLPRYQISSHYLTRGESVSLQKSADTAGVYWVGPPDQRVLKNAIGMIRKIKKTATPPD